MIDGSVPLDSEVFAEGESNDGFSSFRTGRKTDTGVKNFGFGWN